MNSPMNSTKNTYERGDTFCRAADWLDVVKFFFLNYGLHAFTVVTEPGSTPLACIITSVVAIFMPSAGIGSAFSVLHRYANGGKTDLDVALKAGALCMVMPSKPKGEGEPRGAKSRKTQSEEVIESFVPIIPQMTQVHGQYPAVIGKSRKNKPADQEGGPPPMSQPRYKYSLVQVPDWFKVTPILGNGLGGGIPKATFRERIQKIFFGKKPGQVYLACNYSFVRTTAAILQILYGSFELYRARGDQLEKYGYAAYSLTVIPYILMSLANLVASLSAPRYPSMFLVYYGGLDTTAYEQETNNPTHQTADGDDKIMPEGSLATGVETPGPWWNDIDWKETEKEVSGAVGYVYGNFERDLSKVSDKDPGELKIESRNSSTGSQGSGEATGAKAFYKFIKDTLRRLATPILGKQNNLNSGNDEAVSNLRELLKPTWKSIKHVPRKVGIVLFSLCMMAAPYVIIKLLTGSKKGQSTRTQRSWIMCWIVLGQMGIAVASMVMEIGYMRRLTARSPIRVYFIQSVVAVLLSVATFGGFVVVAQMMLQDSVCRRL